MKKNNSSKFKLVPIALIALTLQVAFGSTVHASSFTRDAQWKNLCVSGAMALDLDTAQSNLKLYGLQITSIQNLALKNLDPNSKKALLISQVNQLEKSYNEQTAYIPDACLPDFNSAFKKIREFSLKGDFSLVNKSAEEVLIQMKEFE